jgi:hypothetical protein
VTSGWLSWTVALLPVVLLDVALGRAGLSRAVRAGVAAVVFVALLVPWNGLSAAEWLRSAVGDLSVVSAALLAGYLVQALVPRVRFGGTGELVVTAAALVAFACVFYPLSLGVSGYDPYAHGFYPTVLTALLLAAFVCATLGGWYRVAGLIALAYAGYVFRGLASDNLWDYLFDVPLVVAAAVLVARRWRTLAGLPWRTLFPGPFTIGALTLAGSFLFFAVVLSRVNPAAFATEFTVEDGFIEWVTMIVLFAAFCLSVHRFVTARRNFGLRGRFTLLLMAAIFLFGAGEEISWGQRIFDIETPQILAENNAQKEMNLHNLTFELRGKTYKVNRLVFGRGIAIVLILYLFVLAPLYRRHAGFRRLVDAWAVPVPTTLQIAAYAVVIAVVEGLIHSPKRGEMTEFAGVIVILLNVAFPLNRAIYAPRLTPRDP